MKKKIFSGVQPTGNLHLGNYLGAIKNFVALQNEKDNECVYCVVDLHAITVKQDPKILKNNIRETTAAFLARHKQPEVPVSRRWQRCSSVKLNCFFNRVTMPSTFSALPFSAVLSPKSASLVASCIAMPIGLLTIIRSVFSKRTGIGCTSYFLTLKWLLHSQARRLHQ